MQQNEPVTDDLLIGDLSKEETEYPHLVFRGMFQHNKRPMSQQLDTALALFSKLREGWENLKPDEEHTLIEFLDKLARGCKAYRILYARNERRIKLVEQIQKKVIQEVSENAESIQPLSMENVPTHLTEEEKSNPLGVLSNFALVFTFKSFSKMFLSMIDICGAEGAISLTLANPSTDLRLVSRNLLKVMEAALCIVQEEQRKEELSPLHDTPKIIPNTATRQGRPRSLAVCYSYLNCPQLWVRGSWLYDYGFDVGDQTEVTNPEPGTMVTKIKTPAATMNRFRYRKRLECRLRQLQSCTQLTEAELIKLKSLEQGLSVA